MAGQIIPRGKNTWLLRVFLGRDPQTGKRRYYNEMFHGTKKEADGALLDALQDHRNHRITIGSSRRTVGVLLDGLLLDYKVNGKAYDWCEAVVRVHLRPFFGAMKVTAVGTDQIQAYTAERQAKEAANGTINREMALLRRSFNLGRMATPPKVAEVPFIPMLAENNVRKGFFEHEAFLAVRRELTEEIRPVITFAYYTGCRKGEIVMLRWAQVDLSERVVRLEPGETKNDDARTIPLVPDLYEMLAIERAKRDQHYPDSPWVFSRSGKPILDFRHDWERACKAAGLTDSARLFHDLRRTGVRNLIRAGVPERVAMMISGHKTRAVFDRYNIVSERDLKDAGRLLGEYMQQKAAESAQAAEMKLTAEKKRTGQREPIRVQ